MRAVEPCRAILPLTRHASPQPAPVRAGAVAVSGLVPDLAVTMPDVPFLCHFRRAIGLTEDHPYQEIVRFLSVQRDKVGTAFRTLAYFDGMSFAARSRARAIRRR